MATRPSSAAGQTVLIAGASRGLGLGMAAEFLRRGWNVIGTARASGGVELRALAQQHGDRLSVETLDIDRPEQVAALRARLAGTTLDLLFVNAGTTTQDEHVHVGDVSTEEFVRVFVTNALSPMRVIETFQDLVPGHGQIAAMSSGQASIANNMIGDREVYRGSKAALNQFMRSFAAREAESPRAMTVLAPGWVRTALGGPEATYGVEETAPALVDVLLAKMERPGLEFLDRFGKAVPW